MGLTPEAEDWLNKNVVFEDDVICPHCGKAISQKRKVVESIQHDSFYGDGPLLETYITKDGRLVSKAIQAEPWSSGPVCFLCLMYQDTGERFALWSPEEIENA